MQIVIDIPEDVIEGAKSNPNYYPTYLFEMIWIAIVNGKPLPKGHGKLKDAYCDIKTLEGTMRAYTGDYIIRGVNGEIYPCKPDIFEKTYEKVEVENEK